MSPFKEYRKSFITSIVGVIAVAVIPGIVVLHDAYADDRYVLQSKDIRNQIQAIDNALFEVNQEISFAETERDKRKYIARKEYYQNLKEALKEELSAKK